MINLEKYSDVFCVVDCEEKYGALSEIISRCSIFSHLPEDIELFKKAVIEREKILSTDIGHGVSIAHGKVSGLKDTIIVLGYSKQGILFKDNGEKVHLIFVIASPLEGNSNYILSLSKLLTWVHDSSFREELERFVPSDSVYQFLDMLKSENFKVLGR